MPSMTGVTGSNIRDSDGKGGDDDADSDLRAQVKLLSTQMAALLARQLPSPVGIIAHSTPAPSTSASSNSSSLITAIRNSGAPPPKRASTTLSSAAVAPSTPTYTHEQHISHVNTTEHLPSVDELADVGIDGQHDESTAAQRAAALSTRLAPAQCMHVDEEHDGRFINWYKDTKWKDNYSREAKLMARLADTCRSDGLDPSTSEVMEMICCRIAALDTMNSGHGFAAADVIEGKNRTSIVPHHVRLSAIKEGNMISRITTKPATTGAAAPGNGSGGRRGRKNKNKNSKVAGGAEPKGKATASGDK